MVVGVGGGLMEEVPSRVILNFTGMSMLPPSPSPNSSRVVTWNMPTCLLELASKSRCTRLALFIALRAM